MSSSFEDYKQVLRRRCSPVVLQVAVEQVLQTVIQAEGDEEAVQVETERRAILRDRRRGRHHSSALSESPQQLLQVGQLLWDEHSSSGQQVQDVLPHVGAAHRVVIHQLWGQLWPLGGAVELVTLDPVYNSELVVQRGEVTPQHGRVTGAQL